MLEEKGAKAPSFSFYDWYASMGYYRHGGQTACADALGITTGYVRKLLSGKQQPSKTLITCCQLLERVGEK